MDAKGRIWVALDTGKERALEIAEMVGNHPAVGGFKVNRLVDEEVFRFDGQPMLFEVLSGYDKPVWADIKAHDVPRTVAGRIEPYVNSGLVQFITVMAKGGKNMLNAAVEAGGEQVSIIAVTELTSLSPEEVLELSGLSTNDSVIHLASMAVDVGVRHLVCSTKELGVVRAQPELNSLNIFVPGITPAFKMGADELDQKRTGTPQGALELGATRIVVGSAIVKADDPLEAVKKIAGEIELAEYSVPAQA